MKASVAVLPAVPVLLFLLTPGALACGDIKGSDNVCGFANGGREFSLTSTKSGKVQIRVKIDWQSRLFSAKGVYVQTYDLKPGQTVSLGCSVSDSSPMRQRKFSIASCKER